MNEPSNFCEWPCENPEEESVEGMVLQRNGSNVVQRRAKRAPRVAKVVESARRQDASQKTGLPGRNLTLPSYQIQNTWGALSNKTIDTDLVHRGGWTEYDTHNL
jgi:alpha-glucosidase